MKTHALVWFGAVGLCFATDWCGLAAARLEAQLLDAATERPTAARVAATTAEGTFLEIEGEHAHVQYLGKRWCYVDGRFAVGLPAGAVTFEIRRGFETLPLVERIAPDSDAGTLTRTFRLCRWSDLRQQGYLNGDIHAHLPAPAEAHRQMRAEDLNALTLLALTNSDYALPVNPCFRGSLDPHSTAGHDIYVGQEISDFQMGHLTLPDLTQFIAGFPEIGGGMDYWRHKPHWDLERAMRAARAQHGMVVWSHACSLPGEQLPIGIALGLVDAIELITWNDPTQLPNHWGPWQDSGMSQAEFPVMRTLDLYYQFLNAGFRVPIAAGTDKFGEEIPLGSNRVFAQVGAASGYAAWLAAIKAGRTFVSNGPILDFEVDGCRPGEVVEFKGRWPIRARVTARSLLPFTTLEILCNGETVAHRTVPPDAAAGPDGIYAQTVETTVELSRSSWLAARVAEHPDLKRRILPRDLSVFAHTSPVYYLRGGRPVREPASIAYLAKYVQGVLHWLDTRPPFFVEGDLPAARRQAQRALRLYRGL